ncbi:MAG: hypothetical protein SNJ75_11205 [Gemmataceae bacterium]
MSDALTQPHSAREVGQRAGLDAEVYQLLSSEANVLQAAKQLLAQRHEGAAFRLLAWGLPRREAVWWACECVRLLMAETAPAEERAALEAARRWTCEPTEDHRRQAETAAQVVNFATPAGQCAIAAFWSGGSMAPAKLATVAPPENLLPKACANAVLLATLQGKPAEIPQRAIFCVEIAAQVSKGNNRWPEPVSNGMNRKG